VRLNISTRKVRLSFADDVKLCFAVEEGKRMGTRSALIHGHDTVALAMPPHILPMLAMLSEMPADEDQYGFEYKWDGIRAFTFFDGHRLRLETRNQKDITRAYPELAGLAAWLEGSSVILDGEIVAFDTAGHPSFGRLQHRLGATEGHAAALQSEIPVTYMLFDALYLEGHSLLGLPYTERREILEGLALESEHWKTPPSYYREGGPVLEAARENGLEGVVAKRLDSPYRQGLRTHEWRKIKLVQSQEFVIGGWTPISTGAHAIGALLLGYYEVPQAGRPPGLVFAGKVGTGFSERDRDALAHALDEKRRDTSPFTDLPGEKGVVYFAEPDLVGEVEYRGWTNAGHLRQPSFKGLRIDKQPTEVVKEEITS
jgi:bifunctional non-homologous end joining protein LigD